VKIPWSPRLWDVGAPDLHSPRAASFLNKQTIDEELVPFGISRISFDADKVFFLNGKNLKSRAFAFIMTPVRSAPPSRKKSRTPLLLLKEIGVNAIRTSHNPPDPELLDLCDRLASSSG